MGIAVLIALLLATVASGACVGARPRPFSVLLRLAIPGSLLPIALIFITWHDAMTYRPASADEVYDNMAPMFSLFVSPFLLVIGMGVAAIGHKLRRAFQRYAW